ncbi:MAG: MDR family MFS transporter [Actinobacteria bacterium]|nr:MDR family MFS transporter [Actinomycetota bacterium]
MTNTETVATDAPFQITQHQIRMVYAGMMTAVMLAALDGTIVNTALTTIVGELGGFRAYTWVTTSYLLASTAATPLFGKLSDIYGRQRFVKIAVIAFIIGSLLCAMANSMTFLVAARGVQGVGGGGIMAMSYVVIADIVSPRDRGKYVGAFMSVFAVSSVAGPLLGGFFVEQLNWRWIFLINIPIGIIALIVTASSLKLPFISRPTEIDYRGAFLLISTVASLILMFSWTSEEYGWASSANIAMAALTCILLTLFIWTEPRTANPIMPLRLFRNPVMQVVLPMIAILGAMLMSVGAFMPLFLQAVTGISPTKSGLLLVPMMGMTTISGLVVGRRTSATGKYRMWPILGTGAAIVGMCSLTFIDDTTFGLTMSVIGMAFIGFCVGGTMPTSTLAVQNSVEFADIGVASSTVILFRSLGNTVSLAAFGALVNGQLKSNLSPENLAHLSKPRLIHSLPEPAKSVVMDAMTNAISLVFKVLIPFVVIAFVLALILEERPLRNTTALENGQNTTD